MGFSDTAVPAQNRREAEDEQEQRRAGQSFSEGVGRRRAIHIDCENPAEKPEQGRDREGQPESRSECPEGVANAVLRNPVRSLFCGLEIVVKPAPGEKKDNCQQDRENPF